MSHFIEQNTVDDLRSYNATELPNDYPCRVLNPTVNWYTVSRTSTLADNGTSVLTCVGGGRWLIANRLTRGAIFAAIQAEGSVALHD